MKVFKLLFSILPVLVTLWGGQVNASLPNIFANQSGNVSASELDNNYNAVDFMGITQCTATGTNSIVLAQNANQTAVSSYSNYQQFSFAAAGTSTGSVTVNVNSIGALTLYLPDSVTAADSGSIVANRFYVIAYNSALNSGSGGFVIVSSGFSSSNGTVNGSTSGNVAYYATSTNAVSGQTLTSFLDATFGNTQGSIICRGASVWGLCSVNAMSYAPSNPTGTTSSTGVMMGVGTTSITPANTGFVEFNISGNVTNSIGGADTAVIILRVGTGTAPVHGASPTGSIIQTQTINVSNNSYLSTFNVGAIEGGLTKSDAYWADIELASPVGGTATISNLIVSEKELH